MVTLLQEARVQQVQQPTVVAAAPTPLPATPTMATTIAPPPKVLTTAVTSNTEWVDTVTVVGDFYLRGNPDAPIHLVDYSDFL